MDERETPSRTIGGAPDLGEGNHNGKLRPMKSPNLADRPEQADEKLRPLVALIDPKALTRGPIGELLAKAFPEYPFVAASTCEELLEIDERWGGCGMIRGYREQQLINFRGKVGAITGRRNQTAFGIDADGDDNTAALLRATVNVANDFPARQAAVDGEVRLQPFREFMPRASPRDFDRGAPVGIAQTHKSEIEVQ